LGSRGPRPEWIVDKIARATAIARADPLKFGKRYRDPPEPLPRAKPVPAIDRNVELHTISAQLLLRILPTYTTMLTRILLVLQRHPDGITTWAELLDEVSSVYGDGRARSDGGGLHARGMIRTYVARLRRGGHDIVTYHCRGFCLHPRNK
jgi:hypothetical protein